jgi:serine/threonine protein phosphatase 1
MSDTLQSFNIIGDIAGRFDELMALLEKMPKADKVILVGDLPDRHDQTPQVIQWCVDNQDKVDVIRGNHEILMINSYLNNEDRSWYEIWCYNGGIETIDSYGGFHLIPKEHIDYLQSRPLYIETDALFISHAPVDNFKWIPRKPYSQDYDDIEDFVWNRARPTKPYGNKFMVYGHNGRLNTSTYLDGHGKLTEIAQCVDNSHAKQLCGLYWNKDSEFHKQIFSVDYF